MIRIIIKREMLEYLKSSKFLIGFALTVVLITLSTIINIGDYATRRQEYLDAMQNAERSYRVDIFREPRPFSILVQGKDRLLGNRLVFSYSNLPTRTTGYMSFASKHQSYFSGFASLDFAFVVRVVLSLLVIFLAYNAISEEKVRGTLKLSLANRLPRDQLILGKFFGGVIVIFGSLLFASILAVLIMLLHPAFTLTAADLLRIMVMFGISALFLLCWYTITLFVSVATNRPAISLLILLQVWVFLLVIYPNLSVIFAKKTVSLPTAEELMAQNTAAFQPYQQEYEETQRAFIDMVHSGRRDLDVTLKYVELSSLRTELWHQVEEAYVQRLDYQRRTANTIAALSPAAQYDIVMRRLALTGMDEYDNFIEGVNRAWRKYADLYPLLYTDREKYRSESNWEFTYNSEPLRTSIFATLPQWIILFLYSLVFFALCYVFFLRKDVR